MRRSAPARAAMLANLEIRDVRAADGTPGRMLTCGGEGFIVSHGEDGSAIFQLLHNGQAFGGEYQFPSHVMDEIAHMVAGPTRWEEGETDEPLKYCSACLNGRCESCKGDDVCQCDHVARIVPT